MEIAVERETEMLVMVLKGQFCFIYIKDVSQ